jgi:uncharacterized repeat protein (TIGR01451 family)
MRGTHGAAELAGARRGRHRGLAAMLVVSGVLIALTGQSAAAAGPTGSAASGKADADVSIDLSVTGPGYVGAPIWLNVLVGNAGPATATNVVAMLDFPTGPTAVGLSCTASGTGSTCRYPVGSVPAGAGVAAMVELSAAAAGSYSVRGQVAADQPDPVPVDNVDTTAVEVTELADVSIDLPVAVSGYLGGVTIVSVRIANAGPTTATGIQITLDFPAGLSPIGLSCTPTGTGSTCSYPGGSLPSNTGSIALIQLAADAAGTYQVRGRVTADQPDPNTENNVDVAVVEVTSSADLAVHVAESADPTATGRSLTYTVTVSNRGPSPASSVLLVDTWNAETPGGAELLSVQASQGSCLSTTAQRIDCQLGGLVAGATATVTVQLRPRGTGLVSTQASASAAESDPDPTNNTVSETTTVAGAA